jgi:hypothetical protein
MLDSPSAQVCLSLVTPIMPSSAAKNNLIKNP